MVRLRKSPLIDVLPFMQFMYTMGDTVLDYCELETDLGIDINGTLNWTQQTNKLYVRANQRFAIVRRTCDFIYNPNMKRILYLTLVRSIFEHCPIVWRPSSSTAVDKLESLQKRAMKWIIGDPLTSYSTDMSLYHIHCKQHNILPIRLRFNVHDLIAFDTIVYQYCCVKLPSYLSYVSGTRLRSSHLDSTCFVSNIIPRSNNSFPKFLLL